MANLRVRGVNPRDAKHFQMLGFRDYEAARRLLLSDLLLQGATLASTALEKYLKCLLAIKGSRINLHLDAAEKFIKGFEQKGIDIFSDLDPVFVETLSKAYRLRYYDTAEKTIFGFYKWQLLGELDSTVDLLESRISQRRENGEIVKSTYQLAVEENSQNVIEENHVLLKIDKKDYMERIGPALMLRVDDAYGEIKVGAKAIGAKSYEGRISSLVDIKIGGK